MSQDTPDLDKKVPWGSQLPWGQIITGAATLGGAYLGYKGQQQTNQANAQQARDAMAFEERMSNTAFQRGTADMRAAGINPALAYQKGGADTPSGKTANMENALAAFGGSAQSAVETFNSIQQTRADLQQKGANTELTRAQANQLNLESADRAADIKAKAAHAGSDSRFAERTLSDRIDITNSEKFQAQYAARLGQVDLERGTKAWERDRDVLWPLAVEQLRQDLAGSIANTRGANAAAELQELEIPSAQNAARMAQTAWGRNITPFLSDASKIASALSIGAGGIGLARLGAKGTLKGATNVKFPARGAPVRKKPYSVDWDNIITSKPRRWK